MWLELVIVANPRLGSRAVYNALPSTAASAALAAGDRRRVGWQG